MKFKKGDRIRLIGKFFRGHDVAGKSGSIFNIDGNCYVVEMDGDENTAVWALEDEVEAENVLKPNSEFADLWEKSSK